MDFALLGYCLGTVAGAVGNGYLDALVGGVVGMLAAPTCSPAWFIAVMLVPQGMAYALRAGLPPVM